MDQRRITEAQQLLDTKQAEDALGVLDGLVKDEACSRGDAALIHRLCGTAHEQLAQFNQACESFDTARAYYSELEDEQAATYSYARGALNLVRMKHLREGVHRCKAVLPIASVNGWSEIAAIIHHALAMADYYQGNKEAAARGMINAASNYRELGLLSEEADVNNNLAMIYLELGRNDLAQQYLPKEPREGDGQNGVLAKAKYCINMAIAAWYKGDSQTAKGHFAKAIQIGHEHENHRILANAQTNLGVVYQDDRDYRMSRKMLLLGWQSAEECSDKHVVCGALSALANTMVFLNDPAQAEDYWSMYLKSSMEQDGDKQILLHYFGAIIRLANDNIQLAREAWEQRPPLPKLAQFEAEIKTMIRLFEHIGTLEFREKTGLSDEALDLAAQWCSELGELELGGSEVG